LPQIPLTMAIGSILPSDSSYRCNRCDWGLPLCAWLRATFPSFGDTPLTFKCHINPL
jgi:hypothetical protein